MKEMWSCQFKISLYKTKGDRSEIRKLLTQVLVNPKRKCKKDTPSHVIFRLKDCVYGSEINYCQTCIRNMISRINRCFLLVLETIFIVLIRLRNLINQVISKVGIVLSRLQITIVSRNMISNIYIFFFF